MSVVGQSVIPTLMHNGEDISTHKCGARSGLPQLLHALCSHSIVEQLVLSSGHLITGHGPKLVHTRKSHTKVDVMMPLQLTQTLPFQGPLPMTVHVIQHNLLPVSPCPTKQVQNHHEDQEEDKGKSHYQQQNPPPGHIHTGGAQEGRLTTVPASRGLNFKA